MLTGGRRPFLEKVSHSLGPFLEDGTQHFGHPTGATSLKGAHGCGRSQVCYCTTTIRCRKLARAFEASVQLPHLQTRHLHALDLDLDTDPNGKP